MQRLFTTALIIWALFSSGAMAETVPAQVKSAAFLEAVSTRGLECDLLRPWQASALRALNLKDMERWSEDRRSLFDDAVKHSLSERSCDDEGIRLWIDGASRGFDSEMLPPYLIVYRSLASGQSPPAIFTSTTTRLQYGPAIQAINAKLSALEAAGAKPEGGGPWSDYISGIEAAAREFATTLANEEAPLTEREDAFIWIAQTAHIVELWLLDGVK